MGVPGATKCTVGALGCVVSCTGYGASAKGGAWAGTSLLAGRVAGVQAVLPLGEQLPWTGMLDTRGVSFL